MKYKLHKVFFSLAACCFSLHNVAAQDDLYFNPKRQKEIDRQQAERRANEASVLGLKRGSEQEPQPQDNSYIESWGDVDSLENRQSGKIYELNRSYEQPAEREDEDSYATRLRYDDPTYIVYARDPYGYDPWWTYPYVGFYTHWGNRWGWGLSWGYPYYSYGWGYPYYSYGWGYPYYSSYYYPGWGCCYHHHWGGHHTHGYANVTHRQRTGSMSGTNRGTGYTSGRGATSATGGSRLGLPGGTSYRGIQGRGGSSSAAATTRPLTPTTQQRQSVPTYRQILGGGSTSTATEQRSSPSSYNNSSSSSSSSYSAPSRSSSSSYSRSSSSSSSSSSYGSSSRSSSSSGGSRGSSSGRR
jgi:hypothetical protein